MTLFDGKNILTKRKDFAAIPVFWTGGSGADHPLHQERLGIRDEVIRARALPH